MAFTVMMILIQIDQRQNTPTDQILCKPYTLQQNRGHANCSPKTQQNCTVTVVEYPKAKPNTVNSSPPCP
ncbi:hypothetical protein BM1_02192 [Bipolaris maydis]|nr:hypothetical protein BM1_02192 [Bipolaris maydis]